MNKYYYESPLATRRISCRPRLLQPLMAVMWPHRQGEARRIFSTALAMQRVGLRTLESWKSSRALSKLPFRGFAQDVSDASTYLPITFLIVLLPLLALTDNELPRQTAPP